MNQVSASQTITHIARNSVRTSQPQAFLSTKKQREFDLAFKHGIWFVHCVTGECLPPKKFLDKISKQHSSESNKWDLVPPLQHRRKLFNQKRFAELEEFEELLREEDVKIEERNHRRDSGAAS